MADDTLQPDPGSIVRIFKEGTLHTDPPLTIRQGDILQRLSKLSTETVSRDHFLSLPYTCFLLNGDMKLHRNWHLFI
jgi:hypothetical protein